MALSPNEGLKLAQSSLWVDQWSLVGMALSPNEGLKPCIERAAGMDSPRSEWR